MQKLLTVKEYADLKQISVQAVYQKMRNNTIDFKKIGNTFKIPVALCQRKIHEITDDEAIDLFMIVFDERRFTKEQLSKSLEITKNKNYSVEISLGTMYHLEYCFNGDFYHEVNLPDEYGVNRERCVSFNLSEVYQFLQEKGF
jgi:hypothetical protein